MVLSPPLCTECLGEFCTNLSWSHAKSNLQKKDSCAVPQRPNLCDHVTGRAGPPPVFRAQSVKRLSRALSGPGAGGAGQAGAQALLGGSRRAATGYVSGNFGSFFLSATSKFFVLVRGN
jgi:hypothetical protein